METFWQGFFTGIFTCLLVTFTTLIWIEREARKTSHTDDFGRKING